MTRAVTKKAEAFVKDQLAEARQRLTLVETEAGKVATKAEKAAQKAVKQVTSKAEKLASQAEKAAGKAVKDLRIQAKRGQKEVRTLLKGFGVLEAKPVKELSAKAEAVAGQVAQGLQALQSRALSLSGIASTEELKALSRDVAKLTKKVDGLIKQATPPST